MTEYVILVYDNDCNAWEVVTLDKPVTASSAKRAITSIGAHPGQYVAVPARSWKPLPVKVESKTVVTVG